MEDHSELSYLRNDDPIDVPYTTIPAMVKWHVNRDPRTVAQVYIDWKTFEKEQLTFSEMYNSATKFALGLVKLGIKKGDTVALGADNTQEWMAAMLGIQMSGAIVMNFLFDRKDGSDIVSLIDRVGDKCKAIAFSAGFNDRNIAIVNNAIQQDPEKGHISLPSLPSLKWSILISDCKTEAHLTVGDICKMGSSEVQLPPIDPEDVAVIFLTSGSTGSSKLIPYTHFSLLKTGKNFGIIYGKSSQNLFNDRVFGWIVGFPHWEILTGGRRTLIKHLSAITTVTEYRRVLERVLSEDRYDASLVVTGVLQELRTDDDANWHVGNIVVSGQPVPKILMQKAKERCDKFIVCYGCTEMGALTYGVEDGKRTLRDYECGHPLPGCEIKVVDTDGNLLKRGETGEIYSRPSIYFSGYMNDIEKSAAVRTPSGWFKSDDIGIVTEDGALIVEGRLSDSVIKTASGRLQSVAVWEGRLKQHVGVADAAVVVVADDQGYSCVCCAILPKQGVKVTEAELKEHLLNPDERMAQLWNQIQLPKNFLFFDSFPKTYSGKVNRREVANCCKKRLS